MNQRLLAALAAAFLGLPLASTSALAQEGGGTPGQGGGTPGQGEDEGGRGRRERFRGGFGGGMGLPVERLKEELGLSDEQVAKIEAVNAEMRERGRAMRDELRQGQFDPEAMRARFEQIQTEVRARIDEVLTPEQRAKLQELQTTMRERMRERGGERGPMGRGPDRGAMQRRLREQAVSELKLGPEEATVVLPLLDAVFETRRLLEEEHEKRREAFLRSVHETTDPQQLNTLLLDYRAARESDRAQVKQSMDQLREVLTLEQEARLVALNVLD